jgi:NNP family nitrate/nitrite transporter-like MFS transporter
MVNFASLWQAPQVNPINKKARSIPFFNPVSNVYGRVFFFSWFGFMIAFWSWYGKLDFHKPYDIVLHTAYLSTTPFNLIGIHANLGLTAFPPLLADVIAGDLHMKPYQVANSNIIALTAT